jgi:hypothetical protein
MTGGASTLRRRAVIKLGSGRPSRDGNRRCVFVVGDKGQQETSMAATKRKVARKASAKRELIDTGTNKLFVRRNARGTSFKQVVDVSRSLAADRRQHSKRVAKPGEGDRGDRPRRTGAKSSGRARAKSRRR